MPKVKLFYRQKILLALVEIFNEPLQKIDLLKLLFLLCKESKQDFYSFFPFKHGCFSFQVFQDWKYLKSKKLLQDNDKFEKKHSDNFAFRELRTADQEMLVNFKEKYATLRGEELIRRTYVNHPEYTIKSLIKDSILTKSEQQSIKTEFQPNLHSTHKSIFSIGYESISIDEYLHRLICNDIDLICDVRFTPRSMKYDFNNKRLATFLAEVNIGYQSISELGIPDHLRNGLGSDESYQNLFALYEKQILSQRNKELAHIAQIVQTGKKVALTCFEKNPDHCHRTRVANKLAADFGLAVMNI